jgi:transposase
MKPYSVDFREKIVNAYERGNTSIRVASRFEVSKALVQRLLKQKHTQGHLRARPQGGSMRECYMDAQSNWLKWWKTP